MLAKVKAFIVGMPTPTKVVAALLIVAVVGVGVYFGTKKDATPVNTADVASQATPQNVAVPQDDPDANSINGTGSASSTASSAPASPGASKPTIGKPSASANSGGTTIAKPAPTQATVTEQATPTKKPTQAAVQTPASQPKFVPKPVVPKPTQPAPVPAGQAGQSDLDSPLPAVGAGDKTVRQISGPNSTAPVDPIRTNAQGVLNPPTNVKRVGWWQDSGIPGGGAGSVALAGHIDDVSQGEGAAKAWIGYQPGQVVSLKLANGQTVKYSVTSNKHYAKASDFPADLINKLDGPETLVLVTCGGKFVGGALGYNDNIVVTAKRI